MRVVVQLRKGTALSGVDETRHFSEGLIERPPITAIDVETCGSHGELQGITELDNVFIRLTQSISRNDLHNQLDQLVNLLNRLIDEEIGAADARYNSLRKPNDR
ncbi:hypothetical protein Tcan_11877 [Toxocara canis]|uniref:Uncharacterized protein n=1 Tax=Toxocara canis TaxID=6265 RepID=A0A0B2VNU7_TOXCA|nr:hypothetical protein Tcan_11877 [Toxocara canis]